MSNTLANDPGIAPEDKEIIEHQLNGVESEKEAADIRIAAMLADEMKAGRGKEDHDTGEDDDADSDDVDAKAVADDAAKKTAEAEESDSQRRRRLRREAENRTRQQNQRLTAENARLREKLRNVDARTPDPAAYGNNTADYVADRAAHSAQKALIESEIERTEAAVDEVESESAEQSAQSYEDYMSDGVRRHADFREVVTNPKLHITPAMVEAFRDEGAQDIAYELAKNPAEMNRIASLPTPIEQVKAIWKAQAALEAKAAQSRTSNAPPPIKPLKGSGAAPAKSPSEMGMAEYAEYRRKQMAQSR